MRKDLESLIEQALDNIKNDRQLTEILLSELQEYMAVPGNQDVTQILVQSLRSMLKHFSVAMSNL